MLAGLGPVELVGLVGVADVLRPAVVLVEPVLAAGGEPAVAERAGGQVAVLVELGQAVAGAASLAAVALRVIEEAAAADLEVGLPPPAFLDDDRGLDRHVGCACPPRSRPDDERAH